MLTRVVLPAPLGPISPSDLAARELEVDVVDGVHAAVRLAEPASSDSDGVPCAGAAARGARRLRVRVGAERLAACAAGSGWTARRAGTG